MRKWVKTDRVMLVVLALTTLIVSAPAARADLFIQSLGFGTAVNVFGLTTANSSNNFLIPQTLITTLTVGNQSALALQANNGFFHSYASSVNTGSSAVDSTTSYGIRVGTTTPNTPLILDFHFVGGQLRGDALYGAGDLSISLIQRISAAINGVPVDQWGFRDELQLTADPVNGFANWTYARTNTWDLQAIGLPGVDIQTHNYENGGFMETTQVDIHSFQGTLDFGLLQPGETFMLIYDSFISVGGSLDYPFSGSGGYGELTDPFTLGGSTPPQVDLRGLPPITSGAAPEPGTLTLLAPIGIAAGLRVLRRRR